MRRFNAFSSLLAIMCFSLTACCLAPVGDPGDNVADNPDPGSSTGSDDSPPGDDPSDDSSDDPTDGAPGDSGSDPIGTDECAVDLNGFWVDHASTDRYVEIRHAGGSVSAVYIDGPFVCEHRDEAGTTSQTDKDLSGTLTACVLTGTVTTCTFGCPEPCIDGTTDNPCPDDSLEGNCTNGVTDTAFTATVTPTGDRIKGVWEAELDSGTLSLDRLHCRPKQPADYGLPGDVEWQARRPPGIVGFESQDAAGSATPIPVTASVNGTVTEVQHPSADQGEVPGLALVITVTVGNGNTVDYFFSGGTDAQSLVQVGDEVTPSTPLGTLAVQNGAYNLTVSGHAAGDDDLSETVNPDCIEE